MSTTGNTVSDTIVNIRIEDHNRVVRGLDSVYLLNAMQATHSDLKELVGERVQVLPHRTFMNDREELYLQGVTLRIKRLSLDVRFALNGDRSVAPRLLVTSCVRVSKSFIEAAKTLDMGTLLLEGIHIDPSHPLALKAEEVTFLGKRTLRYKAFGERFLSIKLSSVLGEVVLKHKLENSFCTVFLNTP